MLIKHIKPFLFIALVLYTNGATASMRSEFLAVCRQPTPNDLILLKQIAQHVDKTYNAHACESIYSRFRKQKDFYYTREYVGSLRVLFFFDQLEKIHVAIREDVSLIDLSKLNNLKDLRYLSIRGLYNVLDDKRFPTLKNFGNISSLKNLEFINIENIGINNLAFLDPLNKLMEAHFPQNQIQSIQSKNLPESLVLLNLNKNSVSDLPIMIHLKHLKHLDLSYNTFTDISNLANLSSLKLLRLTHDILSDVTLRGASSLKTLSNLESLAIQGWNIDDSNLFEGLTNLQNLNLQDNKLTEVKGLSTLTSLKELNVMRNNITDLSPLLPLATNPDFDLLGRPNPLRSCSPEKEDHLRAGIICSDNVFNNMWSSLRRIFM